MSDRGRMGVWRVVRLLQAGLGSTGLGLWLLVAGGASAHGEGSPDIEVHGTRSVAAESVRAHLTAVAPDEDAGRFDAAAITRLMATGLFKDVDIRRDGARLVVTVIEHPVIASVGISGASAIEQKTLDAELKMKAGDRYTAARVHAATLRMRDVYRRQGRLATTVTPKVKERGDGRVDLTLVVAEGAVSKVDRIAFAGNAAISSRQLRDVISTSESGWLDILRSAAFYDPERIESDRELLRRYYVNAGFPDASVSTAEAVLNAEGTGYTVTFRIDEGVRHVFGEPRLDWRLPGAEQGALQSAIKVKAGAPYSREMIERTVERLLESLSRQGHPFALVRPTVATDSARWRVDVTFRIEMGMAHYVERIDIVGNVRTKDHVIRRELRIADGDPVNPFVIERARKRVQALGFFKTVAIKPSPGSAPDRTRLTIEVVEQETAEISFGGGYSSSEGLIGDISWTERNLLGNGQYLRFKVAGSATRLQADIGFTEPYFLGYNVAGGFDLFYKDTDYSKQASYKSRKLGGDLRLGMRLTDEVTTSVNYTFVRSTLYDVGPNASTAIKEALTGGPDATSNSYNTSSVGYTTTYDGRDNKKRPTSGVYYALTQDFAGAGGDVRYIRTVGETRAYYAVSDGVTAFGRVTGGTIAGWGGQDVRLLDLFNKGGETVRGFATAGIGPRDALSPNLDALGGRNFFATTAEALFEIPGVPKDLGLRGAVFADAGSLWGVNKTAAALPRVVGSTPSLRASVGVGLAWDSPLGPLRVDYAVPLVKQAYDKTQAWSFGLSPF